MKLLMADDDRDDRDIFSMAFQEECPGHILQTVCDGEELISCLKDSLARKIELPDLILLDVNMPKVDGRVALKEIKSHPLLKDIPTVIYSTSDSDDDRFYALELGAKAYITKPFDFVNMLRICKSICQPG